MAPEITYEQARAGAGPDQEQFDTWLQAWLAVLAMSAALAVAIPGLPTTALTLSAAISLKGYINDQQASARRRTLLSEMAMRFEDLRIDPQALQALLQGTSARRVPPAA